MHVETYEIEEFTTDTCKPAVEVEAQALQLIEELGLPGQQELVTKTTEEDPGTRNPYPRMTKGEKAVYETICGATSLIEDYEAGIFPLRVLQVIAHARPLFTGLEVWHPEVQDPDPVLVGFTHPEGKSYAKKYYLLARWGAELVPFEELAVKAAEIIRNKWEAHCRDKMAECEAFVARLAHHVARSINGDYVATP